MANIILITGGARSGKSRYAEDLALKYPGARIYLATCPPAQGDDPEMAARIEGHKRQRLDKGWQTIEQPLDLCGVVMAHGQTPLFLIDCLTLWVSNLMMDQDDFDEQDMVRRTETLLDCLEQFEGTVIMVSNEVGQGIVPDNQLARRYRDLVGRLNQMIATAADQVFLVSCGLPLKLK